ncbi:MAG: NfeD family protein [Gammaproteobacteria bacterium]|nr:NfeD family protein [Gammaproteobacteria bacterium]
MIVIEQWHWWVLTLGFIVICFYYHDLRALWVSLASAVVGGMLWSDPAYPLRDQLLLFGVITLGGIVATSFFVSDDGNEEDEEAQEVVEKSQGERLVGQEFTVTAVVSNGSGKIDANGNTMKVRGAKMAVGDRVRVTGVDGIDRGLLLVELAEPQDPEA